jgi:hypothetical protein
MKKGIDIRANLSMPPNILWATTVNGMSVYNTNANNADKLSDINTGELKNNRAKSKINSTVIKA